MVQTHSSAELVIGLLIQLLFILAGCWMILRSVLRAFFPERYRAEAEYQHALWKQFGGEMFERLLQRKISLPEKLPANPVFGCVGVIFLVILLGCLLMYLYVLLLEISKILVP